MARRRSPRVRPTIGVSPAALEMRRTREMERLDVPRLDEIGYGDTVTVDDSWLDHWSFLEQPAAERERTASFVGLNKTVTEIDRSGWVEVMDWRGNTALVPARFLRVARMVAPSMGSLMDMPLPPNIPRPEMWDAEAVVKAVKDGFTFLVPFKLAESLGDPNAYWIGGEQYSACALTVGPDHTPEIGLTDDGWIWAKVYFQPYMVPERAWLTKKPNEFGVVAVKAEIDPDDIDFEILNRGHQIMG